MIDKEKLQGIAQSTLTKTCHPDRQKCMDRLANGKECDCAKTIKEKQTNRRWQNC